MYENAREDELKAVITEKNSMIAYLNERNENLQRDKRKVTGQKMKWRDNALTLWDWLDENLTGSVMGALEEDLPGIVQFMREHQNDGEGQE